MFDLRAMRVLVCDQLRPWRIYRLTRRMIDDSGKAHEPGADFRFDFAIVNQVDWLIEIHGWIEQTQAVVFRTKGQEHQQCFEFTGEEYRPSAPAPARFAELPPLRPGESELAWLAAVPEFSDAVGVLRGQGGPRNWGSARADGDVLRGAAVALKRGQPTMARWLAARSRDCYGSYIAQATAGGEAAALHEQVRSALEELDAILEPPAS